MSSATIHTPSSKKAPRDLGATLEYANLRWRGETYKKKYLLGRGHVSPRETVKTAHLADIPIFNWMLWTFWFCFSHFKK